MYSNGDDVDGGGSASDGVDGDNEDVDKGNFHNEGIDANVVPALLLDQSLQVLTVNHVLEIMLRFAECGDWAEAVEKVVPGRKRAAGGGGEGDDANVEMPASKQPKKGEASPAPGANTAEVAVAGTS